MVRFKPSIAAVMHLLMALALINPVYAFFRHLCHGEVGIGRIDPIVTPGKISQHVHGIHGAQNMALEVTAEQLMASNCTSCAIAQDKSAYWSPYLYFQHENGTFQLVSKSGGLTAYYFTEKPSDQPDAKIVAFPPGFRMMAGNTFRRSKWDTAEAQIPPPNRAATWTAFDSEQQQRAGNMVGFNCMHYNRGFNEDSLARHFMPEKDFIDTNCPEGIRAEIMFPSCWNGQLDSDNHQDHVAYPRDARNGPCPPGFDQRFPALFFETIYMTGFFKDFKGQFVFANGDPTGYGYHADFISGWEGDVLQRAIDNRQCTNPFSHGEQADCPEFHLIEEKDYVHCKMETPEALQNEQIDLVDALPGGVQVYAGPGWAPMPNHPAGPPPSVSGPPMPAPAISPPVGPDPSLTSSPSNYSATAARGTGTAIGHGSESTSAASNVSTAVYSSYTPSSPTTPPFVNTSAPTSFSNPSVTTSASSVEAGSGLQTFTSMSTDAAGVVVEWVIVQEIQTTTVYVDSAGRPTQPAELVTTYPLQPVKRHRHRHDHVRVHL